MKILLVFFFVQNLPIFAVGNQENRSIFDCEEFSVSGHSNSFSICFDEKSKRKKTNFIEETSKFCSSNFPADGQLVELKNLAANSIDLVLKNLQKIFDRRKISNENFQWISDDPSPILSRFSCPPSCWKKSSNEKILILRQNCRTAKRNEICFSTSKTSIDRAIFLCSHTKANLEKRPEIATTSKNLETIVFQGKKSCLNVRSRTHQYSFCFRRQNCSQSQTSAFCTTKILAENFCQTEMNRSNLLTIENENEFRLINEIIAKYSDETLLNVEGKQTSKHIVRAQWMWINGIRVYNETYRWNGVETDGNSTIDRWWCDQSESCSGSRGKDHVVLNIVCREKNNEQKICLASRRLSEPGPFICKRRLTENEESISNFTYLHGRTDAITMPIIPVYEKNSTSIYYDENHCLTVQTRTYLYTFCFRRQICSGTQAYCTRWGQANQFCQSLDDRSGLLTIDNDRERQLITDIVNEYSFESRLTFNGSSYRYFLHADFLWIDGIQQVNSENQSVYRWKNGKETIPDQFWCEPSDCESTGREHVTLNLLCNANKSSVCLGSRVGWKLAPFVCKRPRKVDICPILFDRIKKIEENEMLVVTVNRSIALVKCKVPEFNNQIKFQYDCNTKTNQWSLNFENPNFFCPKWTNSEIPSNFVPENRDLKKSSVDLINSQGKSSSNLENQCSQRNLIEIVEKLPTKSLFLLTKNSTPSWARNYSDHRIFCRFNQSIHITYRCNFSTNQWGYVYGSSLSFRRCFPFCSNEEKNFVLDQYFGVLQKSLIRTVRRRNESSSLRFRCFHPERRGWIGFRYQCGTLAFNQNQLRRLNSCFQSEPLEKLPDVTVSMIVREDNFRCPPPVPTGSSCQNQVGHFIYDNYGCPRKVCPTMSDLCHAKVCPSNHVCRIIPCETCVQTGFLRAVCEFEQQFSITELEQQIKLLKDERAIRYWEQQISNLVHQYAQNRRQQLSIKSQYSSKNYSP